MKLTHNNRKTKALETLLVNHPSLPAGLVGTFDLPAGWSCPFAKDCKSRAEKGTLGNWTIHDSPEMKYRCYAASQEALYPTVRQLRWENLDSLKLPFDKMVEEIGKMVAFSPYKYIRLHSSGEFFSLPYMKAWVEVARRQPARIIYGYTKAVEWIQSLDVPDNFRFNVSKGGTQDALYDGRLPFTGVAIEPDGYDAPIISGALTEIAVLQRQSFYIPIHGTQPPLTLAAIGKKFWKKLLAEKE